VKRDPALVRLSWDHHHGLVMALRIERELPAASEAGLRQLMSDLLLFWSAGLLPHFHGENDCLLARLVRHVQPDDELVRRATIDHISLARLVADIRDADGDISKVHAVLSEFGPLLRAHIRWEESVLFERLQELLPSEEMQALGRDLAASLPPLEAAP
jgi:hemerythrin-like domain-containing protein